MLRNSSTSKIFFEGFFFRSPEKIFFGRILTPVSLVLGHEHSCPWPREGLSTERLSLALGFFFCVLGLSLEPCVLDSTSDKQFEQVFLGVCNEKKNKKNGSILKY